MELIKSPISILSLCNLGLGRGHMVAGRAILFSIIQGNDLLKGLITGCTPNLFA